MPAKEKIEDARRQGQFEGRVEAKLDAIVNKTDTIIANHATLEGRVREGEKMILGHAEILKESTRMHEELFSNYKEIREVVDVLVADKNKTRGILVAIGLITPVMTAVITAVIIKALTQ